ncbi:replication protein P [Marinobacter sp.]|uniref:replication protein P n=1 Tax=Marinobacter sp. TaxID=50741 RepID=UPI003565C91D
MQPNEKPSDAEMKMAEAVNVIFDQIKLICPGWKYTWTNESIEKKAKKFWVKALLDANIRSDLEIQCGLHKTLKSGSAHCPPVGKFINWCKPDAEFMGLPSVLSAYQEACRKIHPVGQQRIWSHPAVFVAAQSVGAHELRTMSRDKSWPRFERAYEIACHRVCAGEDLNKEIPKALTEQVPGRPAPKKVAREYMQKLKKMVR